MQKKIALVFPGQGSQTVGMLNDLAQEFPIVTDTFAKASNILQYDLWKLIQEGSEEELNKTERAQPALLTAAVAIWNVWQSLGGTKPEFFAGHSLGEYSALVCAGAISFEDAVRLVESRGKYMQQAFSGRGAMVAIVGLSDEKIQEVCNLASEGQVLVPANYNSIGQTVLSGEYSAAARAVEIAKSAGAKIAKLLAVSVPSHCPLMEPAAELLAQLLQTINIESPQIRVIHNTDVLSHCDPKEIREALVKQLYTPVRWVETIQFLASHGVHDIFECGPGKVLSGLNKRINAELNVDLLGIPGNLKKVLS